MSLVHLKRKIQSVDRGLREARLVAKALKSPRHPIVAFIVPIRRCNLSCAYCNEYDKVSDPVPTAVMLRRIDLLAELGTAAIVISGGEPLLHPDLDDIIRHIRQRGMLATLITNGYLMTSARIKRLNRSGLNYLQISIDNKTPDEISNKSLNVLDRKLQALVTDAEFAVNINTVVGSSIRNSEDAIVIASRAQELGFTSTVGILHDGGGQLLPLNQQQQETYRQIVDSGKKSSFTFAYYNQFQNNLARGLPNEWHCGAGSRYLYVCEDGLVHWCSQQRGYPGIPLEEYTQEDLDREYRTVKPCAPYCTISCVHQVSMIDRFREKPRETLAWFFPSPKEGEASAMPWWVRLLSGALLPPTGSARQRRFLRKAALRLLRVK
ncbi:MAG TPA: radical SAM protein [Blastocatellia bacterium]|nr:radical SAM protein [Blastocatellia bacterium]